MCVLGCVCISTTPVLRSTRHVFLDLPQLSPKLQVGADVCVRLCVY